MLTTKMDLKKTDKHFDEMSIEDQDKYLLDKLKSLKGAETNFQLSIPSIISDNTG